ncbi:MAG: VanZ family protein [Oscillospiraceae bacterium]|nr:VanZ family protein [Oscillospiraceae bacterium]
MTKRRTVSGDPAYDDSKKNKIFCFWKFLVVTAFLFYLLCVLYLMFFERLLYGNFSQFHKPFPPEIPYQQAVRMSIQLKPFATIRYFREWLCRDNPLFPIACKNLAGNLALFFPMGIFLPCLFQKQRNLFCFVFTLTVMIGGAEIIQALTLLGKCDIDDYILNMLGAVAGFVCFQIFYLMFRLICLLWNFLRKRVIYARWN